MNLKDKIESKDQWNEQILLGEGDTMPDNSFITPIYQSRSVARPAVGWNMRMVQESIGIIDFDWNSDVSCPERSALYKHVRVDFGGDLGVVEFDVSPSANYTIDGHPSGSPFTSSMGPVTVGQVALSDPVTMDEVIDQADLIMGNTAWSGDTFLGVARFKKIYQSCTTFGATPPDDITEKTDYPYEVDIVMIQYRMVVPENFKTSYMRADWDEVFYPQVWLDWKPIFDEYEIYKYDLAAWKETPAADRGPKPEVPEKPGTEPARPQITRSLNWVYTSGKKESGWWTIKRPKKEGLTWVRNLRVVSYRSKWGTKPTFYGDRWIP